MKTLFEKIYWTCAIVNVILFVIGVYLAVIKINPVTVIVLVSPALLQVAFILLYFLIVDVVLNYIWGLKIDLFSSLGNDKELKPIDTSKFNVTDKGEPIE